MKHINHKKPAFWMVVAAIVTGVIVIVGCMINLGKKEEVTFARISYSEEGEAAFWDRIERKDYSDNIYPSMVIGSQEEMEVFIANMDKYFSLTAGEDSFQKSMEVYDTSYFEQEKSLIIAYISENSGSIRHRLKDVKIQEELLTIAVESYHPSETESHDMAGWFMVLELENERLQEVSDVVVYQAGTEIPEDYAGESKFLEEYKILEPCLRGTVWSMAWDLNHAWVKLLDGDPLKEQYEMIDVRFDDMEEGKAQDENIELNSMVIISYEGEIVDDDPTDNQPPRVKGTAIYHEGYGLSSWAKNRVVWVEGDEARFQQSAENAELIHSDKTQNHLPIRKIDTYEEWENFREEYADMLKLIHAEPEVVDDYSQMIYDYGEEFFRMNSVLVIYTACGSGSIDFNIERVRRGADGLVVEMSSVTPEVGTDDMAAWMFITSVEKYKVSGDMIVDVIINEVKEPEILMERVEVSADVLREGINREQYEKLKEDNDGVPICRFDSTEELVDFDMYKRLQNILIKYNDAFFEENTLLIVCFESNDIGKNYKVNGVYSNGEYFEIEIVQDSYRITNSNSNTGMIDMVVVEVKKDDVKDGMVFSVDVKDSYSINKYGNWYGNWIY